MPNVCVHKAHAGQGKDIGRRVSEMRRPRVQRKHRSDVQCISAPNRNLRRNGRSIVYRTLKVLGQTPTQGSRRPGVSNRVRSVPRQHRGPRSAESHVCPGSTWGRWRSHWILAVFSEFKLSPVCPLSHVSEVRGVAQSEARRGHNISCVYGHGMSTPCRRAQRHAVEIAGSVLAGEAYQAALTPTMAAMWVRLICMQARTRGRIKLWPQGTLRQVCSANCPFRRRALFGFHHLRKSLAHATML